MASEQRTDESLKVLPLGPNKTISSDDKDDPMTVTSSTQSPTTVNLFDTKIKPEAVRNGGTIEQFVNNDGDNQANQPQTGLVVGDEMDEKSRSNLEKEGRAINFPLGVASNNQNSTAPAHMLGPMNFVTTTTEKTHVMSFFDLSDVSMDHDNDNNGHREVEAKGIKTTTDKKTAGLGINNDQCTHNETTYKVSC